MHLLCGAWRPIGYRQAVPAVLGTQKLPQHSIYDPIGCIHVFIFTIPSKDSFIYEIPLTLPLNLVRLRNSQFINPKIYILAMFTQSNLQFYILQQIQASNHFQTVGTIFSPEQNQPRNPKTLKSSEIDLHRLAGNHYRQAVHQKPKY